METKEGGRKEKERKGGRQGKKRIGREGIQGKKEKSIYREKKGK